MEHRIGEEEYEPIEVNPSPNEGKLEEVSNPFEKEKDAAQTVLEPKEKMEEEVEVVEDTLVKQDSNIVEDETINVDPTFEGNPFDLNSGEEVFSNLIVGGKQDRLPQQVIRKKGPKTAASKMKNFKLASILIMLLILASLTTFFRHFILKTVESFTSDNLLRTNYRATGSMISIPYLLLELFFVINISFTFFLIMNNFNLGSGYIFKDFFFCLSMIGALVLGKHLVLWLIGYIFPIRKETEIYNFTISNFYIIMGLLLVPVNLFLAYSPEPFMRIILYITAFLGLGLLLYLAFRGLLIGLKYLSGNRFHFFMYLCTVEIAPLLIIFKMVDNYVGV